MSPAVTWDAATAGQSTRQAAQPGNGIRACARIAAGSGSRSCQQGKGLRKQSIRIDSGTSQTWPAVALGLTPALFHSSPSSLTPSGLMRRAAGSMRAPPSVGLGRQVFNDALRQGVQPLETHSTLHPNFSRRPTPPRLRLRDLRNVPVPAVDPESRRSTWTKTARQRVEK